MAKCWRGFRTFNLDTLIRMLAVNSSVVVNTNINPGISVLRTVNAEEPTDERVNSRVRMSK